MLAPTSHSNEPLVVGECSASSETPWFGEMSLCRRKPHRETTITLEASKILRLPRAAFKPFLEILPDFLEMVYINATAVRRLNAQLNELEHSRAAVAAASRVMSGAGGRWHEFFATESQWDPTEKKATQRFRKLKGVVVHSLNLDDRLAAKSGQPAPDPQAAMLQQIQREAASLNPHPLKYWQ
ncbi:MAG: hypothetical protein SGPRY_009066, partial [Prymnesium sp.]